MVRSPKQELHGIHVETWHNAPARPRRLVPDHPTRRSAVVRKIISFTHATLDGYIDEPHMWSFPYSDDELQDYALQMTLPADALLFGRITYDGMAQAWPTREGNPFADHVNSITKYVVASQPVDTTAWDPTVVIAGSDLLDEVGRLKQAEGGDILTWGTGRLTDALAAAGLLDEYRICTSPVVKGGGEPLFRPASTGTFELLDSRTFATGAVVHAYGPTAAP
jgi:dihydrofolate reductase